MYENFTEDARRIMALANEEALRAQHEYIGTEHVLLGVIKEGSSAGAKALRTFEVDLGSARAVHAKLVLRGPDMVNPKRLPFTPRGKKLLQQATEEAENSRP